MVGNKYFFLVSLKHERSPHITPPKKVIMDECKLMAYTFHSEMLWFFVPVVMLFKPNYKHPFKTSSNIVTLNYMTLVLTEEGWCYLLLDMTSYWAF